MFLNIIHSANDLLYKMTFLILILPVRRYLHCTRCLCEALLLNLSYFTAPMQEQDLVNKPLCICYIVWLNTVQCGNEEWQSQGREVDKPHKKPISNRSSFPLYCYKLDRLQVLSCFFVSCSLVFAPFLYLARFLL